MMKIRAPKQWLEQTREVAEEIGTNRSDVVRRALRQWDRFTVRGMMCVVDDKYMPTTTRENSEAVEIFVPDGFAGILSAREIVGITQWAMDRRPKHYRKLLDVDRSVDRVVIDGETVNTREV